MNSFGEQRLGVWNLSFGKLIPKGNKEEDVNLNRNTQKKQEP
jgi:tRNA(Glu) U13 pseudouridine synthase TruD